MNKDNIQELLSLLEFEADGNIFSKRYPSSHEPLRVDINGDGHIYYKECGITIGRETTCNLLEPENLVVLHCVDRLLWKGYSPFHIELEPAWKLGHSTKGGYADVWVRTFKDGGFNGSNEDKESLLIIECKTWGKEFDGAWIDTKEDGAQLFSYFQQERATKFLCLYTADIIDGKLEQLYHLINVQDNEEKLLNDDTLKSYRESTNNKQLFKVWRDTYHEDYATRGLFDNEIAPYRIGKNKYSTSDLNPVDNDTIQKKYNEFALILRQHNVGGHENAFDKLVNLFLAKVVDETNNPDDLHFYWKGSSYDDDYHLQDRLQRLYRDGMKKFLNEDVTYIENSQIEKAFRRFKNDPDATKKTIMEYFRALKFFSDNDFSFISVHNKKLFEQNAAILLKVVKMLQDIKLKDSDQNQLLGDLFEGFLNKGVKQSEGQYFTPMPIVRFLVAALPLEYIINNSDEIPNVIDYACGAGHFLTEYAVQVKEYVEKYRPTIPLKDYYSHITGIEKEYRLSKVSKVSAFMYGHDDINIIYSDALVPIPEVKNETYDILIANPPYSVKGFLETLSESDRSHYSLYNDNINIGKNNAIQSFFVERAAQLLKAGGVAAIILPVTLLNKGSIYTKTREIILESFDIIALVEFGTGTFGKTGTETVTMFLRRKETNTPDASHYRNRVNSWFDNTDNESGNEVYEDLDLLNDYCNHCDYEIEDYYSFMTGTFTPTFLENEIIQTYKASFWGNQRNAMVGVCEKAKEIRSKLRSRQNTQSYKRLTQSEKDAIEQRAFFAFVTEIEKDKVYYYILSKSAPNPVVIVKAPSGITNMKKFLGYEWSDSKGNEGIKYLNVSKKKQSDDDGNGEDDDTLQQIKGIKGIVTPLFNPQSYSDPSKINTIINDNFCNKDISIPDELVDYVEIYNLVDLIDFKRTDFNKTIKTTPILSYPQIETQYDSEKIGKIAPFVTEKVAYSRINPRTYVTTSNMLQNRAGIVAYEDTPEIDNVTRYKKGDILISNIRPYLKKIWLADHNGGCSNDVLVFRNTKPSEYSTDYLYTILSSDIFFDYMMVGKTGLKMPRGDKKIIPNFLIPKAPYDTIQKKIVNECGAQDKIYKESVNRILELENEMYGLLSQAQKQAHTSIKLNRTDLFEITIGRRVLRSDLVKDGNYDVYSANVFEPFGTTNDSVLNDFTVPSVVWGIDGDWMVNYIDSNYKFNPTDHCGVIRVLDNSIINPRYLVYPILKAGEKERFSRSNRASIERIKTLSIMLPDINIQNDIAEKLKQKTEEIVSIKKKMKECTIKKQAILDKYLK